MIKLTEQQFFDYITCPVKYDLKYNKKIIINEPFNIKNILDKLASRFYIDSVNEGKFISLRRLESILDSLIKPYQDMISPDKLTNMMFLIRNFHNYWMSITTKDSIVCNTGIPYILTHNNNILEGITSPIAKYKDNRYELLIMNFSTRMANQLELDTKLKYTIDTLAFNLANKDNNKRISGTRYIHVKTNKTFFTGRTENDITRFYSSFDNVCKAIENNIYYPRESHMCDSCLYKHYCRGWRN